jgi:hypothetical protein
VAGNPLEDQLIQRAMIAPPAGPGGYREPEGKDPIWNTLMTALGIQEQIPGDAASGAAAAMGIGLPIGRGIRAGRGLFNRLMGRNLTPPAASNPARIASLTQEPLDPRISNIAPTRPPLNPEEAAKAAELTRPIRVIEPKGSQGYRAATGRDMEGLSPAGVSEKRRAAFELLDRLAQRRIR